jgi:hypothetical protein
VEAQGGDVEAQGGRAVIEDLELRGDVAWVEVVEGPVRRARFYRRTGDGWKQTAPRAKFWGEPKEVHSGALIVRYRRRDEAYVNALLPYLEQVSAAVAEDLRYNLSGRKVIIALVPELSDAGSGTQGASAAGVPPGAQSFRREIDLPSPWVSGMPADGVWDQEWLSAVAYEVTHTLALKGLRSPTQPSLNPLQRALADEYATWVSQGRDRTQAPFLARIIEHQGEGRLPIVLLSLKSARLPSLFVVRWLSLFPSGDETAFFEMLLNVEREALLAGRKETFMLFQDATLGQTAALWEEARAVAAGQPPPPVRVAQVEMAGEVALVRVQEPWAQWDAWRRCETQAEKLVCRDEQWWNWMEARRIQGWGE